MNEYAEKNARRRSQRGEVGSKQRRMWRGARDARRDVPNGAFGNLRLSDKTRDAYAELAFGTAGET